LISFQVLGEMSMRGSAICAYLQDGGTANHSASMA
jgi:hypothetical protein